MADFVPRVLMTFDLWLYGKCYWRLLTGSIIMKWESSVGARLEQQQNLSICHDELYFNLKYN